ncbi:reverse transcriptase domain-containing protein [Tanacetum coccineum]
MECEILRDIEGTFHNLRRINMKLNPKKCTFSVEEGAFLGHVVSMQGIKACPKKVEVVMKLQSPPNTERSSKPKRKVGKPKQIPIQVRRKVTPFFKTLKRCIKKSDFQWTPEAEKAFQGMKKCITELPMVTAPKPKEELIMYLCAAREAISAVLLTERDSWQIPIYFVSNALQAPEINYNSIEKVVLALVHATRRLRSPSRNPQKKVDRRKGNPSNSGRRRILLDDTTDRIPHERHPTSGNNKGMRNQDQGKTINHD